MKTLFVVSANVPDGLTQLRGGPIKDYMAITRRLGADVLDHSRTRRVRSAGYIERRFGLAAAQAWVAASRSHLYDVILTDGEHIGIPLALLLKLSHARVAHVTIGHRLTATKKRPFFQALRVQSHMDAVVVHSRCQYERATTELGFRRKQLVLLPYQVDATFWQPIPAVEERLIVSAGLEHRDYPTLLQATAGLEAKVIVAAASTWSKYRNTALDAPLPANVEVSSFDYHGLRALLARAAVVAVPVDDVDFQAGITTVLEAMAMGKPVVVTHTAGQTDVVEDRRSATRGGTTRPYPVSLLRQLAEEHGIPIEPNGFYVPPHDPDALRRALTYLLDHPEDRARLGAAGRRAVEQLMTVQQFAERIARVVEQAATRRRHACSRENSSGHQWGVAREHGWSLRRSDPARSTPGEPCCHRNSDRDHATECSPDASKSSHARAGVLSSPYGPHIPPG